jgi:hypothetical protein
MLPTPAETLDELVLVLPKGTPVRFDATLGFHFYGADVCLQVRDKGLAAIAVDALCFHNQRAVELPPDFEPSGRAFAAKWAHRLPVKTTCAVVDGGRALAGRKAIPLWRCRRALHAWPAGRVQ